MSVEEKHAYALLEAKIDDTLYLSEQRRAPCFTSFLALEEQAAAKGILKQAHFENYLFYGGYEKSERAVLGIFPKEQQYSSSFFPITPLAFMYRQAYNLSHRDFLGALMSCGIKREALGDILTEPGRAVVFVKEELSAYITAQIQKVGNIGVSVSVLKNTDRLPPIKKPEEKFYTMASVRLDSVVSALTGMSRDKSAKLILAGNVFLNHQCRQNVSMHLKQGDTLSIRGYGKYIIGDYTGLTKKGRVKLVIKQYR